MYKKSFYLVIYCICWKKMVSISWRKDTNALIFSVKNYSEETSATASIRRRFPLQKLPLQRFASSGFCVWRILPLQQLVCSSLCLEQFSLYQLAFVVACFKLDLPWRWLLSQFASATVCPYGRLSLAQLASVYSSSNLEQFPFADDRLSSSLSLPQLSSDVLVHGAQLSSSANLPLQKKAVAWLCSWFMCITCLSVSSPQHSALFWPAGAGR